jgi:hypothetical protein
MYALVGADVQALDSFTGDPSRPPLADEGEHGTVVEGVTMDVQEIGSGGGGDGVEDLETASLAHVDDALEHTVILHYRVQGPDGTVAAWVHRNG